MRAHHPGLPGPPGGARRAAARALALSVLLLGVAAPALAEQPRDRVLTAGEYFLNTDPGEGNGTPIATTWGFAAAEVQIPLTLAVNDVVYVRFKSSNGLWGASRSIPYTWPLPNRGATLVAAEYFVNTDPGPGNGTPVTVGAGGHIQLPRITIGSGDRVYVRVLDSFGRWSAPTSKRYLFKQLRAAEYRLRVSGSGFGAWTPMSSLVPLSAQPAFYLATSAPVTGVQLADVEEVQVRFQSADYIWGSGYTAPAAPDTLTAAAPSAAVVNLGWHDLSGDELGFEIERKIASGSFVSLATVPANTVVYQDLDVAPRTTYTYRVRSFHAHGQSAWSNEAVVETPDAPPAPPANLAAEAVSYHQVNLTWEDHANNETGFEIERRTASTGFVLLATAAADALWFADSTAHSDTSYTYRVRATNALGQSSWSNEAPVTTPDGPPAEPTGLMATAVSPTQIDLTWHDESSNETGFEIERQAPAGEAWQPLATVGAGVVSYPDSGLAHNTSYSYRVRAVNDLGSSAWSNEATAGTGKPGDVDGDGVVNVGDVFYLINALFAGGPAAVGLADANGDGVVDVQDVFYLINYLFAGGPQPV